MTPVRINLHRAARSAFTVFLSLVVAIVLAACWDNGGRINQGSETGLSMQVERGSQELDIVRAEPGGTKPAGLDPDSWTVFVYLCGSDLESDDGAATIDLSEMVAAEGSDKVSLSSRPVALKAGAPTRSTVTERDASSSETAQSSMWEVRRRPIWVRRTRWLIS